ncbi:ribose-phosphate pyrophosphokinase [Paenibacillus radicis (ex Xue et al. 2023)]|uniref:Ribose-phosphate pyrophosphokinase n=1 Tax=Paenibacillus radicis (ex Xue et al. 2023) TaxID=2972489 RepID=A0ABT1YTT5_9BACL|nr:ribose-phosphate pyrophosphokinase [Paenibacillus radicis (ex Xue et al. 2023)]MCR8636606.1 ribose-phosphate pyrophosphokinase [Paenibacillus radicis (ex Xue et al. 2023)]
MIQLNGVVLEFKLFPNGETLVDGEQILNHANELNIVTFKYENDSDLIKVMFLKNYLDDLNFKASLVVYYMPYSRMDRVEGASAFTLKYVSNFINSLNFDKVTLIEPHSDVSLALINKSTARYPSVELLDKVIAEVGFNLHEDYLFFPDAGAQKRYGKVKGYQQLVGFKVRDFQTGQIRKLDIVGSVERKGFKVIIVDDLCSYGGTFILSAEKLKEIGASEIYLLVGHCEKSIYKGKILETDTIDKVFTTNSMLDQADHEKIHVFEIGGM